MEINFGIGSTGVKVEMKIETREVERDGKYTSNIVGMC
jgi:hypothetical protein